MRKTKIAFRHTLVLVFIGLLVSSYSNTFAQETKPYVRMVKMVVDSLQLDSFRAALKEHSEVAVKTDPGVLTFYAVYDKAQPNRVTIFEIYASIAAYESHGQTPGHLKYISTIKDMVGTIAFVDVVPIALETKRRQ